MRPPEYPSVASILRCPKSERCPDVPRLFGVISAERIPVVTMVVLGGLASSANRSGTPYDDEVAHMPPPCSVRRGWVSHLYREGALHAARECSGRRGGAQQHRQNDLKQIARSARTAAVAPCGFAVRARVLIVYSGERVPVTKDQTPPSLTFYSRVVVAVLSVTFGVNSTLWSMEFMREVDNKFVRMESTHVARVF